MTNYCSTTELVALSGSTLDATEILSPIIDAADREIDAYLAPYGLTGSATGAIKQASLKLSMAGLLERGLHTGNYQSTSGDFSSSVDTVRAIESNRKAAYTLLDQYISNQTSLSTVKRSYVRRIDGI